MFRFTTLAMVLVLAFTTAVLTGCDSGGKGTSKKGESPPPPSGSENAAPAQTVPNPK